MQDSEAQQLLWETRHSPQVLSLPCPVQPEPQAVLYNSPSSYDDDAHVSFIPKKYPMVEPNPVQDLDSAGRSSQAPGSAVHVSVAPAPRTLIDLPPAPVIEDSGGSSSGQPTSGSSNMQEADYDSYAATQYSIKHFMDEGISSPPKDIDAASIHSSCENIAAANVEVDTSAGNITNYARMGLAGSNKHRDAPPNQPRASAIKINADMSLDSTSLPKTYSNECDSSLDSSSDDYAKVGLVNDDSLTDDQDEDDGYSKASIHIHV